MKCASAKQKGRKFQQYVRDLIRETFGLEEDDVRSTSMGCGGEDIQLSPKAREVFPYSVECKNVEKLNVYEAYAQAEANSKEHEPILFMKKNYKPALAVVHAEHYFKILGELNERSGLPREGKPDDRSNDNME